MVALDKDTEYHFPVLQYGKFVGLLMGTPEQAARKLKLLRRKEGYRYCRLDASNPIKYKPMKDRHGRIVNKVQNRR